MILQTIETFIGHWVTVIKAHEKLLLALILAFTLIHFGNKAYDAYGDHLKSVANADNVKIAQIEQSNAKIEADLLALKASVDAKAKVDDQRIATAKNTIIVKQKQDAALPLPELAKHWNTDLLPNVSADSIIPLSNGTLSVSTDAAHATVNELEKVQPLQDQLIATNDKLQGCTSVRAQQDVDIAGLKTVYAAEQHARVDDAKQAKHDARTAYFKGLKHGLIIGVPVGVALTVAAIIH
jgi:hypothetical protein